MLARVRIPFILLLLACSAGATAGTSNGLVDINRASVAELLHVSGMTRTWAARIVRYRPYRSKRELVDQGIVSPEVYQRIRDGIVAHKTGPE
jgi:DNA uptake protein ComE-like DNA-binding protein